MSKTLTKETTFRERAGSYSTHGSKRGVNLLGWDYMSEEALTLEQERAALVAATQRIQAALKRPLPREQYERLGKEQCALQARIAAIRPKLRGIFQGLGHFILSEMKGRMTSHEWELLVRDAKVKWKAYHDERVANGGAPVIDPYED